MKTFTKKMLALGLMGLGMVVVGCAQDNEKNMNTDPVTGKTIEGGVTPSNAPKSSKEFMEKNKPAMSNPENAKKYKDAQQ
jgi:hypothetical protein